MKEIREFAASATSEHTRRAYRNDWAHFTDWCRGDDVDPGRVACEAVAEYLRSCAASGLSFATIRRRLAAIQFHEHQHGRPSPSDDWLVRQTMRKLQQELRTTPRAKKPALLADVKRMLRSCPNDLMGLRDRAILLIGFTGALRRSEIAGLRVHHIERAPQGLVLSLKRKQTSRRGASLVAIPFGKRKETCPVRTLLRWLEEAEISQGPVFRAVNKAGAISEHALSDKSVAEVVKYYAGKIGKRAANFSGHSLRSGFAVSAAMAGATLGQIRSQTGHATLEALRQYTGSLGIFQDHAAAKLDL